MKKFLLIVTIVALAAVTLAACAPAAQTPDPDVTQTQQIKAVIENVGDSSLLVVPIEGLDDIDRIYLNFRENTVIDKGDPMLKPGNVVTAVIGTQIMESYPPQVELVEVLSIEPGDSTGVVPGTDTQLAPDDYLTGKVTGIDGNVYTVEISGSNVYTGTIEITIPDAVLDADKPIESGYLIGLYFSEEGETITAEKLVFSEPDQVITLDDRETVSGYLDGLFPSAIYTMADEQITVNTGEAFAIRLEQDCQGDWEMTPQENVTLNAQGTAPADENGCATQYFGITAQQAGVYTVTFVHHTDDGDFDYSFQITAQ